jgi:soluble lytic murein transglycosylase
MKIIIQFIWILQLLIFNIKIISANNDIDLSNAIREKKWFIAKDLLNHNYDKSALRKLILSEQFIDITYSENKFEEVVDFVRNNTKWPQINSIKSKIEQYLNNNSDKETIINWYSDNKPQTANGYKYYALAVGTNINKNFNKSQINIIKNGWIYGDFNKSEEKNYLKNFKKFLKELDHFRRVEEQLFRSDIEEAKRSFDLVKTKYRKNFNTQIAFILKNPKAISLFHKINKQEYSAGLIYQYLLYIKKHQPTNHIINLFQQVSTLSPNLELAKLQFYYAREFIWHKDTVSAYKLLSIKLSDNLEYEVDRQWLLGFISLNMIKNPQSALKHFEKLEKLVKKPISHARALYWLGRSKEALGLKNEAAIFYHKASNYSFCFYGQIALAELNKRKITLPNPLIVNQDSKISAKNNDILKSIEFLLKNNNYDLAIIYIKNSLPFLNKKEIIHIVNIAHKYSKNIHHITDIAKSATWYNIFIKNIAFPIPYDIKHDYAPKELIYAIIRQESVFNKNAVSTAKAMGLMQLIETTAAKTAKQMNISFNKYKLTNDPNYNILLGSYHIKHLLSQNNNSYILSIASYNANPISVKNWIAIFGDPRKITNMREAINWIELIPFAETRNYVQRILENMQIYNILINNDDTLRIREYLLNNNDKGISI